jgi:purine-nucleoside phosphorylase
MVGDCVYALDKPGAICIYSGTCGGLDEALEIGDFVLTRQAVCADGYSHLFGYDNFAHINSDKNILQVLESAFKAIDTKYTLGTTFTTSSVVRENDLDFWNLVGSECKAIEMGCASFYAASLMSNKRSAAYFWVTDLPKRGKSFFESLTQEDIQTKQDRFDRIVSIDIELLSYF